VPTREAGGARRTQAVRPIAVVHRSVTAEQRLHRAVYESGLDTERAAQPHRATDSVATQHTLAGAEQVPQQAPVAELGRHVEDAIGEGPAAQALLEHGVDEVVEAPDRTDVVGRGDGHGVAAYAPVVQVPDAVLEVNRRFYDAFERGDMAALAATWEHSERAVCTHPGWATIHGWSAIAESWEAILRGGGAPQFILTAEVVVVDGDLAWVTLDENLIGAGGASGTVAALNLLARGTDGQWRLVAHHGSSVVGPPRG
jgi:ketosteroid isomerase-like protein